jgi:Arc/MetJ-type ribon-helix-helix transcriptional regulator
MSEITIHLPESLQRSIQSLAEKEGYSVDQFLASAAAEKMAALRTLDYLRREAAAGRREDFERFLAAVPDQPPAATDRLPD